MSANRRQYARVDVSLSAEIRTSERSFTARTRNLSEGGCCIEGAYPLIDGASIAVSLFLVVDGIEDESMPPLSCGARVQWTVDDEQAGPSARYMAGLQFDGATDEQKAWLARFLARTSN